MSIGHPAARAVIERRYGEPDWSHRPTCGHATFGGHDEVFPPFTNESYEEFRLRNWKGRLVQWSHTNRQEINLRRGHHNVTRNDQRFHAPDPANYLSILKDCCDMIDVTLGSSPTRWHLHSKLLTSNSGFFKAIINSAFREGKDRCVNLPDDGEAEFVLFVQWLYSGDFDTTSLGLLLRAYTMGDKLAALEFRDRALDKVWSMNAARCKFTPTHLLWVFENTMPDSGLRKLALDTVGLGIISKELNFTTSQWETLELMMPEILQGVIRVASLQNSTSLTRLHRLDYRN